jgi:outer membrane protein insertion porin family
MNPEAELFGPPPIAAPPGVMPPPGLPADIIVDVEEDQTGRLMFGAGINSDLGLSFQAVLDERSFDIHQFPDSWDDIWQGRAFRGGGQRLRLEAIPGNRVQRYLISFTEPYLGNRPISLNASAYLYNRAYFDWDEERLGARLALGYLLTPDLSLSVSGLAESLEVHRPRLRGVPELEAILGHSQLYAPGVTLAYDTRDVPFFPTEGQYLEMSFQQYFGSYTYPRGEVDYRRYLLLKERPDGSGRHVLGNMFRLGISGSDTPIVENFFAGGFATLRGFSFRGASPVSREVRIGGPFMLLGSTEYIFPITADDMLRGVVFADYGTIEEDVRIEGDDFRLSLGFGVRITVPALGAAPLAVDFAVPVMHSDTDRLQNVSFWFGMGR